MRSFLGVVLALTLFAGPVMARGGAPKTSTLNYSNASSDNVYNLLEGVALNAAAAARTITVSTKQLWAKLVVPVFFTYGTSATTVTAQFKCSTDGTNYVLLQSRAISAGASTLSDMVDTKTTGGVDQDFMLEYDVRACRSVQVVFGASGPGGSDLINVQATAVSGD